MTLRTIVNAMMLLSVFMLIGFFVREKIKPIQKLFLPSSLIGGLILLFLGQQMLGVVTVPKELAKMPGVLIDVVMASLVFGVDFNKEKMRSYLDYSCMTMSGYGMQMAVGTALGFLLAKFWLGLPQGWDVMGVFSFHGGHGTAAATAAAFEKLGVEGNMAVGMVLSTIGLIVAMVVGMAIVKYGVRRGWGTYVKEPAAQPDWFYGGVLPEDKQKSVGHTVTTGISINHLALQFAWLLSALFVGQQLFRGLGLLWAEFNVLLSVLHGVVGGTIMWKFIQLMKWEKYVDLKMISLISGFLLELVIFSAMATIDIEFISSYAVAIAIYSVVLVVLTVPLILFCASRFCKDEWFEKGVMAFGAATGNTSTGLALVRAVDPDSQSHAGDTHGVYSTLMSWKDAFVGLTPLWLMTGMSLTVGVGAAIMLVALGVGLTVFRTKRKVA